MLFLISNFYSYCRLYTTTHKEINLISHTIVWTLSFSHYNSIIREKTLNWVCVIRV